MEDLCLLIGSVLGRCPGSSALQLLTSVLTPGGRERGEEREERRGRMLFSEDLSSLATQPAQGKGGDKCEDGAGRKEMERKRKEEET